MRKVAITFAVVFIMLTGAAATALAKQIPMLCDVNSQAPPMGNFPGVKTAQGTDTFYYGGTVTNGTGGWIAATPYAAGWVNRKMWSFSAAGFNGTPHSGQFMDGWHGVDNTAQTDNYFYVADNATMGQPCVLDGTRSLFCGVTSAQSIQLCFVDQNGTGYGNNWSQTVVTPSYAYNAGDQITLNYVYNNESEPGYDFTDVILQCYDAVGLAWVDYDTMAEYTDVVNGSEAINVTSYLNALTPPITFRVRFTFSADGAYSDEDGSYPTACGGFELDSYQIAWSGGSTFSENFENVANGSLPAGWAHYYAGCGDYAHVKHVNDLPVGLNQDPWVAVLGPEYCDMGDSVLVFYDESNPSYPHPLCQNNYAESPVIDLSGHPGLPGKFLCTKAFCALDPRNQVFMYWQVRYKPGCASGGWSPWVSDGFLYYTSPLVTRCMDWIEDVSAYVPPNADQVQIGLGVTNMCSWDPWDIGCTYQCNDTPYFDNVSFGLYGSNLAPRISMKDTEYWQDQFAEDGTLNPTSTADTRVPCYLSNLTPPIFGDTLTCRGTADNMEVYFVFRMAKVGPRQATTHPFFTTWFPGVTGGGWKEARMDTAEVTNPAGTGIVPVAGRYMSCFHEADPVRIANGMWEGMEILPNNLFVPGTRIEYFLKAKYVGSPNWYSLPDTAGSAYEEFEVLPMFRDDGHGGLEWPCLLLVDYYAQWGNDGERNSDRIKLHLRLRYCDVFHKPAPTSVQKNGLGRGPDNPGQIGAPGTDKYGSPPGASDSQLSAYVKIVANFGKASVGTVTETDKRMWKAWLSYKSDGVTFKALGIIGEQIGRELHISGGLDFLGDPLGTAYVSATYNERHQDWRVCTGVKATVGGNIFLNVNTILAPGKPPGTKVEIKAKFDWPLALDLVADGASVNELQYDSQPDPAIAAVSHVVNVPGGPSYRTLTTGFDFCRLRNDDSQGYPTCGSDDVITTWLDALLDWFDYSSPSVCSPMIVSVNPNTDAPPAIVTSLAQAYPNPTNPASTIKYSVGAPGKVTLRVFDVAGRVVRTLVDETKTRGVYTVTWDGRNDTSEKVGSGVFFYQLEAPGFRSTKKLVIVR